MTACDSSVLSLFTCSKGIVTSSYVASGFKNVTKLQLLTLDLGKYLLPEIVAEKYPWPNRSCRTFSSNEVTWQARAWVVGEGSVPAAACLLRIVVAAWAEAAPTLFLKEGAAKREASVSPPAVPRETTPLLWRRSLAGGFPRHPGLFERPTATCRGGNPPPLPNNPLTLLAVSSI